MANPQRTELDLTTKEILASTVGERRGSVTIEQDALATGPLEAGQVLGIITASDKYGVYDVLATDGREVARCLLGERVYYADGDRIAAAYYAGTFKESELIGLTPAAITDLGGTVNEKGEFTFHL